MADPLTVTRPRSGVLYRIRVHAFEALLTFLWFSILPLARLTDRLRNNDDEFSYEITIYQYYYIGIVGAVKVGVAIGLFSLGCLIWSPLYAAIISSAAYLALSGGIHLDGLTDTIDSLFAYGKDKWEVLKDPHIGAMGAAYLTVYSWLLLPTLAYAFYWIHADGQWYHYIALVFAVVLPRMNTYVILHRYVDEGAVKFDKHLHLQPKYDHWPEQRKLTLTWPIILSLVLTFSLAIYCLFTGAFSVSFFLVSALIAMALFNQTVIPKITKTLGFLAGDVFGLMICCPELVNLMLFALWFVRT